MPLNTLPLDPEPTAAELAAYMAKNRNSPGHLVGGGH